MSQSIRHPEILDTARREGKVTVHRLAEQLGVTQQTIRRDLSDLAEAGRLERVHGGAILPSGTVNIVYEERRSLNREAKIAIARAAAARIPDGAAIFLGIGTTTEAVAAALLDRTGLMVVTNNLNVAQILGGTEARVTLTGGDLRAEDGGLTGPMAAEAVSGFRFDIGVIGCSALSGDGEMLDFDPAEVAVSRTVLTRSRHAMLVADRSKLSRVAPVRIAGLDTLGTIVTDADLPEEASTRCGAGRVEVVLARP